jgi:hypothetical protein
LKHVELNQPYENDSFIRIWDLDPKIGKNEIAKFLDGMKILKIKKNIFRKSGRYQYLSRIRHKI